MEILFWETIMRDVSQENGIAFSHLALNDEIGDRDAYFLLCRIAVT